MIRLLRTDSRNTDFIALVKLLDADLAVRDGSDHAFYSQFNKIDLIRHVVLAYEKEKPVGCGAIKEYDSATMEIKRMYVRPEKRSKGIAATILLELEKWAAELSCSRCILETGWKQPEAIRLYEKNGYWRIENYGPYTGIGNSLCFQKNIAAVDKIDS